MLPFRNRLTSVSRIPNRLFLFLLRFLAAFAFGGLGGILFLGFGFFLSEDGLVPFREIFGLG